MGSSEDTDMRLDTLRTRRKRLVAIKEELGKLRRPLEKDCKDDKRLAGAIAEINRVIISVDNSIDLLTKTHWSLF